MSKAFKTVLSPMTALTDGLFGSPLAQAIGTPAPSAPAPEIATMPMRDDAAAAAAKKKSIAAQRRRGGRQSTILTALDGGNEGVLGG